MSIAGFAPMPVLEASAVHVGTWRDAVRLGAQREAQRQERKLRSERGADVHQGGQVSCSRGRMVDLAHVADRDLV